MFHNTQIEFVENDFIDVFKGCFCMNINYISTAIYLIKKNKIELSNA